MIVIGIIALVLGTAAFSFARGYQSGRRSALSGVGGRIPLHGNPPHTGDTHDPFTKNFDH